MPPAGGDPADEKAGDDDSDLRRQLFPGAAETAAGGKEDRSGEYRSYESHRSYSTGSCPRRQSAGGAAPHPAEHAGVAGAAGADRRTAPEIPRRAGARRPHRPRPDRAAALSFSGRGGQRAEPCPRRSTAPSRAAAAANAGCSGPCVVSSPPLPPRVPAPLRRLPTARGQPRCCWR